jgi:hypothetical protein
MVFLFTGVAAIKHQLLLFNVEQSLLLQFVLGNVQAENFAPVGFGLLELPVFLVGVAVGR